jgi:hypothetical protein
MSSAVGVLPVTTPWFPVLFGVVALVEVVMLLRR